MSEVEKQEQSTDSASEEKSPASGSSDQTASENSSSDATGKPSDSAPKSTADESPAKGEVIDLKKPSRPDTQIILPPPDSPFSPAPEDDDDFERDVPNLPSASGLRLTSIMDSVPPPRPDPLVQVEGLSKRFGKREVVRGVDLEVGAGEIVGLLGRNGAGKTTTFRMIMGILKPDSGWVRFENRDITKLPMYARANRGLGYLAQEPSVFQRMTVEENLLAVLELKVSGKQDRDIRLNQLIRELGLETVRKSLASTLSGGERRRLEIARARTLQPRVVLFDEPFAGIDPIAVNEIQNILRDLKSAGVGVLLTDHNVRETLTITDRTYIMDEGRIWIHGSPKEIVNHPEARRRYLGHDFRLDF